MLCEVCKAMFQSKEWKGTHHRTLQDLKAANPSCRICFAIYSERRGKLGDAAFDEAESTVSTDEAAVKYSFGGPNKDTPHIVMVCESPHSAHFIHLVPSRNRSVAALASEGALEIEPLYLPGGDQEEMIPSFTGHPDVLKTPRKWLTTCETEHPNCSLSTSGHDKSWRPKRLLDLTTNKPRLLFTDPDLPCGPYAALSHCWGPNPSFLALTSSNLSQLHDQLPLSEMPKTFLDAIDITRTLGLQYLWIDSLCILQLGEGSEDDWKIHVNDMSLVYANCAVNIAADRAKDPSQGCFAHRNSLLVQQCDIMWRYFDSEELLYTVIPLYNCGHQALKRLPLSSRAWVIQERLLSPRVLHFGAEQIFWECAELPLACESVPFGIPHHVLIFDIGRPFSITVPQLVEKVDLVSIEDHIPLQSWFDIVSEYSSCSLTKPSKDKLSALAAVAQQFASRNSDEYLAGIFLKNIYRELVWSVHGPQQCQVQRVMNPYRAPTWSWASIDGRVDTACRWIDGTPVAKLVGFEIELESRENRFGAVKSAKLTLRGFLIPICMSRERNEWNTEVNVPISSTADIVVVVNQELFSLDDPLFPWNDENLWFLPVLCGKTKWSIPIEYGLILRQHEEFSAYTRVGMYHRRPDHSSSWTDLGFSESDIDLY